MKQRFRDKLSLNKKNTEQLKIINKIIEEYADQGFTLTLRQLYYQLVSRNIIANEKKEYSKLSGLLVKGRMAGVVDWNAIEDRTRMPFVPYWVHDVEDAINDTVRQFRFDRQRDQEVYVELWVEKDALSGVLKEITSKYHINLMVNKGYSSCSAMHDAFKRFKKHEDRGKETHILYLGDHDPSGLDMIRDVRERLEEFGVYPTVKQIGLTMDQIKEFNPPPNPAKIKDPRAKWYLKKYGDVSWEVDALNPKTLHKLVRENVEDLINMSKFRKLLKEEENQKQKLSKFASKFEDMELEELD